MIPPEVKPRWEDNSWWIQASIIQYESIREHEEFEILEAQMKIKGIM